ncbi:MAG: hypothetical protein ACF8LK_06325 [Phycisphaerales bacterium JB041]
MRLRARVRQLEQKREARPCAACGGFGVITLLREDRGQTREDAKGCKACGRVSKLIVLGARHG